MTSPYESPSPRQGKELADDTHDIWCSSLSNISYGVSWAADVTNLCLTTSGCKAASVYYDYDWEEYHVCLQSEGSQSGLVTSTKGPQGAACIGTFFASESCR